jgi:outer membrane protein OmpA-like peptidoglycan-associated protein
VPAAAPPQAEAQASIDFPIFFPSGSSTLTPQAQQQLANLGRALVDPRLASFRFRIEGHTDTVGDAMMNQSLSERRAMAVRDYLVRQFGVGAERLQAIGLGEGQLAVPTRDETPEPRNRRVRVVNLDG